MVYESDFYTTRRPYRTSPSLSTYTVSSVPSRQVRILPGLGKVHVVHTYDRIVPYVGHKRLTVVTSPPPTFRVRSSVLHREYDRIERKYRPWTYYSPTNHYLNSESAVRMIYVRNPYTGINYYTVFRPVTLSPSRWLDLVKYDYNPLIGYRYYKYSYPSSNWADYLDCLYGYKYRLTYRPFGGSLDYLRYYYYPLLGYRNYRYYYPSSTWIDYISYYRNLYSVNRYDSLSRPLKTIFDDETRSIRAETAALLKRIHYPVVRASRPLPIITSYSRYDDLSSIPARLNNDNYIYKLLSIKSPKSEYTTYYTEPVKRFIGQGHLSCVTYGGEKAYGRRRHLYFYEDPVKNDIQLLSYYINKFKQEKALGQREPTKVPLSASRPSRVFTSAPKTLSDSVPKDIKEARDAREARLAKIYSTIDEAKPEVEDPVKKAQKQKEEARLAEERALQEENARKEAQAKKEEAARKAELARQEELAAQAAAERAAELERLAEQTRQEELAKQAAIEKAKQEEEERARLEEERRLAEEAKAEEERQQLLRLEELARQAEEEKEAELARQAEELAELARQEAELAEQAKREEEEAERLRKQAEEEDLARQEAELAELEKQEKELAELARQEAELAEIAKQDAEQARKEAELAELARQEAEIAELERQQAELDALEAEARALEAETAEPAVEEPAESDAAVAEGPQTDEDIPADEQLPEESQPEPEPVVEEPAEPEVEEEEDEE